MKQDADVEILTVVRWNPVLAQMGDRLRVRRDRYDRPRVRAFEHRQ